MTIEEKAGQLNQLSGRFLTGPSTEDSSEKKKVQPPPPTVEVEQIQGPTIDAMLDAMVRAWTDTPSQRFKKVCYDAPGAKPGLHEFFVLYGPKASEDDKTLAEGWWYVEQQFFRTSAGRFYTNDISTLNDDQHVYPDVTGLVCKDR